MDNEPKRAVPLPIETLPHTKGFSFIGLMLEQDTDGNPMWDLDHYQFVSGGKLVSQNSGNYTNALKMLTHWMPDPEFPNTKTAPDCPEAA